MLKKEEYRFTVKRPYPPLYFSLFCAGHSDGKNYRDLYFREFSLCDLVEIEGGDIYYSDAELGESARLGYAAMATPAGLRAVQKELVRREEELVEVAVGRDLLKFTECYKRYTPALTVAWSQEDLVAEKVRQLLSEKMSASEGDDLLGKLNVPLRDNFYKQEEYDLVNASNLKEHVRKYEWIKSRYGNSDPYTIKDAERKLRRIDRGKFLKKWEKEKKETEEAILEAKRILGDDGHMVDVMQFIVYYRTQRTDIINKAIYLFIPTLRKMAADLGLTYGRVLHCLADELPDRVPSAVVLDERIIGSSVIMEDKKIRCVHGEENREMVEFFRVDAGSIEEFKGSSACRGVVRGKARLVFGLDDFGKVKESDVLVTSMTTPNMLPAMKKAAAFVTDEGGITCHAAIVSRELGKPCIIGTKIATQVLKDGDMVEVDADEGVVRVIK